MIQTKLLLSTQTVPLFVKRRFSKFCHDKNIIIILVYVRQQKEKKRKGKKQKKKIVN